MSDVSLRKAEAKASPGVLAMVRAQRDQTAALGVARRQGATWWLAAPAILLKCLEAIVAPIRLFNLIVETAVAMAVVAVVALLALVYTGDIPQDRVVGFLKPLGKKVIDTVQSSAAPSVASAQDPDPDARAEGAAR